MRVVVTGAAGFIGSALVRHFLRPDGASAHPAGIQVVGLDSLIRTGSWSALGQVQEHDSLSLIASSILDSRAVAEAVADADVVIHCAAETSVDASFVRVDDFIKTNVAGTHAVLSAAETAGVDTFIHFSTDEVYGPIAQGSAQETRDANPTNPYARSKAQAEAVIMESEGLSGMRVVVVRPSNNYGPWQVADNLIPRFVTKIVRGERVPIYGSGEQRRCWVHVEDTVAAVSTLIGNGEARGVFNIAGEELSNLDVTSHILRCLNADWSVVEHVPGRPVNDARYCNDDSKLQSLGYSRRRCFGEEIPAVVEHYRRRAAAQ
ncbi:MAG: NAD-dependent epimerase/dehydratase family protein [Actinomycetales bacterium]|nr:NAD-dependent epimerase/dehydratase family protein [Actinomycetales bacterium]